MYEGEYKSYWDEEWKDIIFKDIEIRGRYRISNYGRVLSYNNDRNGKLLKLGATAKYKTISLKDIDGNKVVRYVHRLIAMFYLKKPSGEQEWVIHLDNIKHNNYYRNLKWVTKKEKVDHQFKFTSGVYAVTKQRYSINSKLTESQVKMIKRKINDPNRKTRMKIIAKRYGVSVMQLYRIKSGENWSSVSPD
jgi:hypothetical protein